MSRSSLDYVLAAEAKQNVRIKRLLNELYCARPVRDRTDALRC
jgi:hypothetical protein